MSYTDGALILSHSISHSQGQGQGVGQGQGQGQSPPLSSHDPSISRENEYLYQHRTNSHEGHNHDNMHHIHNNTNPNMIIKVENDMKKYNVNGQTNGLINYNINLTDIRSMHSGIEVQGLENYPSQNQDENPHTQTHTHTHSHSHAQAHSDVTAHRLHHQHHQTNEGNSNSRTEKLSASFFYILLYCMLFIVNNIVVNSINMEKDISGSSINYVNC